MTNEDFAARICAPLIKRGAILADGEPHRVLESVCKQVFPTIRAALRTEWEREGAEAVVVSERPELPVRPT